MSTSYTDREFQALLFSLLPARIDLWMDCEEGSDLELILKAIAIETNADAQALADLLAAQITPTTATSAGGRIQDWEKALGYAGSTIAKYGTDSQRVGQVISKLREWGTPTPANITAALAAVTGNVTSITILEHSRATLTIAHTYSNYTGAIVAAGDTTQTVNVGDNAPCSKAGAQLFISNLVGAASDFTVTLTGPDATTKTWSTLPSITIADPYPLYAPEFAGKQCDGLWTVLFHSAAAPYSFDSWGLFVEGEGRIGFTSVEGLDSRIYEWSAAISETLVDPGKYDRAVALDVTKRWNPAHCEGSLVLVQTDGTLCALCDDAQCLVDFAVAC